MLYNEIIEIEKTGNPNITSALFTPKSLLIKTSREDPKHKILKKIAQNISTIGLTSGQLCPGSKV
jgi:hypothetical protein